MSLTVAQKPHSPEIAHQTAEVARPFRLGFLSSYWPRRCGLATFTTDLCRAIQARFPEAHCSVTAVNDGGGYAYNPEVRFQIRQQRRSDYVLAAQSLNRENLDALCLQHEFGVFGGPAGSHLLALLDNLDAPLFTTLHTVLRQPDRDQEKVTRYLIERSQRLVVMTHYTRQLLQEVYAVPEHQIDLIPHGIPDVPFAGQQAHKQALGLQGRTVLLTFGLLSPGKGIENALKAMVEVAPRHPDLLYLVLGATHPHVLRQHGEAYRHGLQELARQLGLESMVTFEDRFVELDELTRYLSAADIYVTPYLNEAQAVSGTLAYAFGCGKPVVSTPYWHARELLAEGRGMLVPFGDPGALGGALAELLNDRSRRLEMAERAYRLSRGMVWNSVAGLFMESMLTALRARVRK